MSNNQNDDLFERAEAVLEEFCDTTLGRVIERDINANDLEALYEHVAQAEHELMEFESHD